MISKEHLDEGLRRLFEDAAIGIALASLNRDFLLVNRYFADMLGYSIDELQKMNVVDITHPEDMETNVRLDDEVVENKIKHFTHEKRYIHRDGTVFWVLLTVTKAKVAGEEVFLAQVQDISKQKELERLKEIQTLNSIIVTYHHEINNPLAIISGVSQLLRKDEQADPKMLDKIDAAVDRIQDIVISIGKTAKEENIEWESYADQESILKLKKRGSRG